MIPENPAPVKIKVLIVDDHPLVRERLAELINREPDLIVAGEAEDRNDALSLIGSVEPLLVIVDLSLKTSLGFDLIKDLQAIHPRILILVVSMQDELIYAERCLRAGARGYITKQQASRHVMLAIRKVLSGEIYLSEAVTAQMIGRSMRNAMPRPGESSISTLADRELQVFELIGRGHSTKQIAELLSLDVKTIETYRGRIKDKLGLKDSSDLLQQAIAWVHQRQG